MPNIHTMVSTSIGSHVDIQIKTSRIFKFIKVWAIGKKIKPIEISTNIWLFSEEKPDLRMDEFVVTSVGEMRPLIKEVKETGVFIDTGKRVQFNTNLWGEVWRLRPEHLPCYKRRRHKMNKPKVILNLNLNLDFDKLTRSDQDHFAYMEEVRVIVERVKQTFSTDESKGVEMSARPEVKEPTSRHHQSVAANTRIMDAIEFINKEMRLLKGHSENGTLKVFEELKSILLGI